MKVLKNCVPHAVELQFQRKLVLKIIHRAQVPEISSNFQEKKRKIRNDKIDVVNFSTHNTFCCKP